MTVNLPTVITKAGLQPQLPAALLVALLTRVAATNPGYTANLPGGLIEDISSTDVAALAIIDQARVESVNSLTPLGANEFLLTQLGQMLGVPLGAASNTSVFVTFTGPPGFVVAKGFTVSDGNHQYIVQDGGIIQTDGQSAQLFAVASIAGTWAVPANTVTQLVTSVPTSITLTATNLVTGTPGADDETAASYRTRVLQANLAASQGMARYLKTLLGQVEGVQQRLVSAQQADTNNWRIIVGGGDPYAVAYAIYTALFNINDLVGSVFEIASITEANPGLVTTFLNHGLAVGQELEIVSADPTDYNDEYVANTVPSNKTFTLGKAYAANGIASGSWAGGDATLVTDSNHGVTVGTVFTVTGCTPGGYNGTHTAITGTATDQLVYTVADPGGVISVGGTLSPGIALVDTSAFGAYVDGGVVLPNARNIAVTITDWPDSYVITYINPPLQTVVMTVSWNTSSPNFVAPAAVAQLAAPALVDYVNSVYVGRPLNLLTMDSVFRTAVESVLPPELITVLDFSVSIAGVGTSPTMGTKIIEGDPESYFYAELTGINVVQV